MIRVSIFSVSVQTANGSYEGVAKGARTGHVYRVAKRWAARI